MNDEIMIDVRESRFSLTTDERALLQTLVDRNVLDLDELGRSLGTNDEGVFVVLSSIAEKLDEFRYLAANRTPPLGTPVTAEPRRPRRRSALRAAQ